MRLGQKNTLLIQWSYVALQLAATLCMTSLCPAPVRGEEYNSNVAGTSAIPPINAGKVFNALANHNRAPKIISYGLEGDAPLYDKEYDWQEDDRIIPVVRFVKNHAEMMWPELLKRFDDERYCISVATEAHESGWNCTVGRVCQDIVRTYLTAAYERHMHILLAMEREYMAMIYPSIIRKPKDLLAWCEERKEKELYELQMEMCEWAIKEAVKTRSTTVDRRKAFVQAVKTEIKALYYSQAAVRYKWLGIGFGMECFYTPKIAEKIRNWYRKENIGKPGL